MARPVGEVRILEDKTISGHHADGTITDIHLPVDREYEVEIDGNFVYFKFEGYISYPFTHLNNVEILKQS